MQKYIICISILVSIILCGCGTKGGNSSYTISSTADVTATESVESTAKNTQNDSEMRAVWFSYIDLDFSGKSDDEFRRKIDEMFARVKRLGMNTVVCQVRANSDAAYSSALFPRSAAYGAISIDPLEYMCGAAHANGLKIHAWVNPYRVTAAHNDPEKLPDGSPAKLWLTDGDKSNDHCILKTESGIYYNPAAKAVRELIYNGVKEILDNYEVDGIQFDDYFYPSQDEKIDKASYTAYKKSQASPLSLDDWRRTNVNIMVGAVYRLVHKYNNKIFGISPAAYISDDFTDDNYRKLYADIYSWAGGGYVDYIAPQIYFGYEYPLEYSRFDKLLKAWCDLPRDSTVKLYIGLAPYKIGKVDAESDEWQKNDDIVARQIRDVRQNEKADGFMLYSYTYLTDISKKHTAAVAAIEKAVKENDRN